ncbi:hypothetical protein [Streptomyces sp. NPDC002889]|uniref:hypothetical protein n=1 Tax=Streptomyces sp. NPDC002889 TaxID=3364669 RepID=UPI00369E10F6
MCPSVEEGVAPTRQRLRFEGWIAGVGTSSGVRLVLGHWARSPFGPFNDVMLEQANGRRLLLAPTAEIGDFIAGTYTFDEVQIVPVTVDVAGEAWSVTAPSLDLHFTTGRRDRLGALLHAVPGSLAIRPAWSALVDVPARLLLGVRTCSSNRADRREWYGVQDLLPISSAVAIFGGNDLGPLARVEPPVHFGAGSVPRKPAVVRLITTVGLERGASL